MPEVGDLIDRTLGVSGTVWMPGFGAKVQPCSHISRYQIPAFFGIFWICAMLRPWLRF